MTANDTTMAAGTPKAEVDIDDALVRALLEAQHPDLADEPIEALDSGWDNAMFRLGSERLVRLPRRSIAVLLIEHEQRWLPVLAPRLPLAVPAPERVGVPGCGYPWRWSVLPRLLGTAADLEMPHADQAPRLAEFLAALHQPAPADAPASSVRGVSLQLRADAVQERMARLERSTDLLPPAVQQIWQRALEAPDDAARVWLHGDLHARNVLVHDGAISGIIDWGDITAGDPATDLASIWMLLPDAAARRTAIRCYGDCTEATWQRARGWAILFGVFLAESGAIDHPRHAAMGRWTLRALSEGP